MDEPSLIFDPIPPTALSQYVIERLNHFNLARTGADDWQPVGWFLRAAAGDWVGGLTGQLWGGWLHVQFLWIAPKLRGHGQGSRLLGAAEEFAAAQGCADATLETFSFQAPGFYQARGYTIFGTLDNYPPGHRKFFLRKRLAGAAARP